MLHNLYKEMSKHDYSSIQLVRQVDSLVQDLVDVSETVHKLEINPTSKGLKKQVTLKMVEHIDHTRDFINLLKTLST